ncbi:hypothetical protein K469DRAFT_681013 [Zopfia rhizophila CBS 207.26]|uniref:Protein kinase domain-containing protein n=1 Tax=Zopfia rhizophila CBS 207.26 TaxID=1314779 RepID=A0A6A6D8R6_9PEZI|nr:hypothetical protein K469DRAFT_681013 [Zopfia rhizophila CBS 207.26]
MSQSPDYKELYFEEQRRREEEQRRREEEQRRREEEQRRREEEQRRREEAEHAQEEAERAQEEAERAQEEEQRRRKEAERAQEKAKEKTRKTTLLELLDACHTYLYSGLTVQTDATLSTRGDPANANNKLRPERICAWKDFATQQEAVWNELMESDFVLERHFTSLHTLEESGEAVQQRMMSSELDLHLFQRYTVEDHISSIIEHLYNNRALRRKFRLRGSVKFENHANTLSPEPPLEEGIRQMTVSGNGRRRSPRLQAQAKQAKSLDSTDPTEPAAAATTGTARSRPRADQFCVYNTSSATQNTEHRIAAFIIEYKAPHKLPLGYIYEGLDDMELEDVIWRRETDTPRDYFRRLIAAVITQAFSYMVRAGLEYGCICTGEAFIFLRVPDDPRTVYYFLSVPKGDVGEKTGWAPSSDGENRLHLTAVGQMLAFTLQALKTPPRDQMRRAEAAAQLNSWEVMYDDLLDTIPVQDAPSSEYRPPRHDGFLRMSPVQLRRRPAQTGSPSCWQPQDQHDPSDEEPDPDTPSRQRPSPQHLSRTQATAGSLSSSRNSRQGVQSGQYCTQKCLLGLVKGGPLDTSCPNVRDHGGSRHRIDLPTFLVLIRQQLSEDLDTDCKPVGVPGACGVLFRVRLKSHGYTVAAKSTPIDFVHRLKREATIYEHLRPIQGIYVPVHLGNIDLDTPYFYDGIAELVHMMLLSFGGKRISHHCTTENRPYITQQVDRSARAIHDLGVLHKDLMPRNILWNEEMCQVIVIDFERAEVVKPRTVLGVISANRKRKRGSDASMAKQGGDGSSVFVRERQRVAIELRGLA